MTNTNNTYLSPEDQKRLIAVEMDVRQAMKEACRPYVPEIQKAIENRKKSSRMLLAGQIGKLIFSFSLLFCFSGCGLLVRKLEIPDILIIDFPAGLDFQAGANSIDRVDNNRGIAPASDVVANPKGRY